MNEREELKAIAAGDICAFERLFFRYQPRLVSFLSGLIHDNNIGRDMAQDIFLSLWEHRDRLASVTSFSSYLFSIAQYTIYNFYDHQKVEHKYLYEYLAKHPSDSYSEEETLFARELDRMVDQVINNLSPQRRRVYLMSRKEGLSNEEIAQRLGISRRTVDNHLTAVLAILRRTILFYLCLFYL